MKEEDYKKQSELLATFQLGHSYYGIETDRIQEFVLLGDYTLVPHAPDYVLGIINLRGKIVTVINLACKLGLGQSDMGEKSRIIILPWKNEFVGLLVDRLTDVIDLEMQRIETTPSHISVSQEPWYQGIYQHQDRLITILNTELVLKAE